MTGSRPSEPILVPAAWLAEHTGDVAAVVTCHPGTGARLDAGGAHATGAYRPGTALAALVRARDGRCRFPGCSVAARLGDLDHVRPWPTGPTDASNLLTLCRRHHRIKQAPGWTVKLHPDGRAAWSDPTGRTTVTDPLDALDTVVLHPDPASEPPEPPRRVGEPGPGGAAQRPRRHPRPPPPGPRGPRRRAPQARPRARQRPHRQWRRSEW